MSEFNGKIASQSLSNSEILNTVGNFPYWQASIPGPETTGVADVLVLEAGDALKIDTSTGKVSRYEHDDSVDIYAIVAEDYDSTALHAAGSPSGHITCYTEGVIREELVFMNSSTNTRENLTLAFKIAARKMNLRLV